MAGQVIRQRTRGWSHLLTSPRKVLEYLVSQVKIRESPCALVPVDSGCHGGRWRGKVKVLRRSIGHGGVVVL